MKKMFIILALVAVACAPAMAAVNVCYDQSGTTVTVKYTATGNSVRAFAIDASVSTGTITAVTCSNASYYIYPGQIQITSGSVSNYGSCVCSSNYPSTKGGVGTSGVTIEMGSLYTGTNKPASSGTLFTMTISNSAATVTLAAESARGGVVMENPAEDPSLTIGPCSTECFPSTYTTYNDWKTAGQPNCWCGTNASPVWKFQCYGDADNLTSGAPFYYRVYSGDLNKIISNWKKKITDPTWDRCSDIDHKSSGAPFYYRVYSLDLNKVISNWKKKDSQFPGSGNCPISE